MNYKKIKISIILIVLSFVTACFHPLSDEADPGPVGQQPDPVKDNPTKLDKSQYFHLKANVDGAFEKSLKTYLKASLSENYYYRSAGIAVFDEGRAESDAAVSAGGGGTGGAAGVSASTPSSDSAAFSSSNVSSTNLIEQGVDEADLIKSDGQYLYVAKNQQNFFYGVGIATDVVDGTSSSVRPVTADTSELYFPNKELQPPQVLIYTLDSTTPSAAPLTFIEMAQDTNRIQGLYLNTSTQSGVSELIVLSRVSLTNGSYYQEKTRVTVYDLTDPSLPTVAWTLDIDGSSVATRLINGKLLLVTRQYLDLNRLVEPYVKNDTVAELQQAIEKIAVKEVLPKTYFNSEVITLVEATDCIVPQTSNAQSYFDNGLTTILMISLSSPDTADSVCTLESSGEIYVSQNAVYMTKNDYIDDVGEGTLIHKFALNDSGLAYRASGRVPGTIGWRNNAFRMSEYQDYFRLVTSVSPPYDSQIPEPAIWRGAEQTHHLFILKEDKTNVGQLSIVSQLPNESQPAAIGKVGEQVYGVRFNGNYGYVVTFKKIDPLYVLNLVNPEQPFIEGELELPGYSDYLHPVNENILIGIGKDAIEENGIAFYQGIKVGIFDISDKTNPLVVQEAIIGKRGTDSVALSDHHAFTYFKNPNTGVTRFAFPVNIHDGDPAYFDNGSASTYYNWQSSGLQLFELAESNGVYDLSSSGLLTAATINSGGINNFHFEEPRALVVDDAVFLADKGEIWASNWYTPETVQTTVSQQSVTITGYLSIVIEDPVGAIDGPVYQLSIRDSTNGQIYSIHYPSTVVDEFLNQSSTFGKLVTVTGIITSVPGQSPREIKLSEIKLTN